MTNMIIGTKAEMTSKFNELGKLIPVTVIAAQPNFIVKMGDKIQIAAGKSKKIKKPQNHYVTAIGFAPKTIKNIKSNPEDQQQEVKVGDQIKVSIFEVGDIVRVTGTTKGHGFAGGIKRHGFHGGPKTHGQSDRHRAPGSIGKGTTPGRVFKGKKMAGHYGNVQFTVTGLEVVSVNENENTILVKGAVPGWRNGTVIVEKTGKVKKHVPLFDASKASEAAKAEVAKVEETEEVKAKEKPAGAETENVSQPENQNTAEPEVPAQVTDQKEVQEVKSDQSEPVTDQPAETETSDVTEAKKR